MLRVLLDPTTPVTLDTPSGSQQIDPSVLIECGGLILVLDSANDWLMGQQGDDGTVVCWASYGTDLGVRTSIALGRRTDAARRSNNLHPRSS